MFILYFALWVILNGRWTTEIGLFGLAFAAAAYVFSCKFMGYKLSLDIALIGRIPSAVRYCVMLFGEIIKSNLAVMRMVLDKDYKIQPHLVQFDVDLVKDRHRVVLANSITLTPGTITVSLDENHYVVHSLDKSLVDGLDNGVMASMLVNMERKHLAVDAKRREKREAAAMAKAEKAQGVAPAEAVQETAAEIVMDAVQENEEKKEGNEHEH